jgi:hypothetical protein
MMAHNIDNRQPIWADVLRRAAVYQHPSATRRLFALSCQTVYAARLVVLVSVHLILCRREIAQLTRLRFRRSVSPVCTK